MLESPDRDQAMEKIRDLTMFSDIFPAGYHGACTAGVATGSTVYIAGCPGGPGGRGPGRASESHGLSSAT